MDSIINFRDNLDDAILDGAINNAEMCDVMISLGSTMTVTPANSLIDTSPKMMSLIICNRQVTDYDHICQGKARRFSEGVRVFGDCDTLMKEIMPLILTSKELSDWENEQSLRLKQYNSKRK
ncbi:unnamed protein product [Owenia fusiformis]|uniref:Deacetylase sirtuin-type domain-containing protein n=1 Tax=Owenia fusiformis TaxID=6347 RepID=A0A8S4PMS4_OWEFU|nr:unnamed protein product [Owenia fusiformis]